MRDPLETEARHHLREVLIGGRWPKHPCDSEADARRLAAYRDGRTVVSRLVGPWEAASTINPELTVGAESPDSPAAKMRSLRAHPHGSACICDDCTARDEAEAHMAAMEDRHQHDAEQDGDDRV